MSAAVIDTDVVSFLFKRDSRAQIYLPHLENRTWIIFVYDGGGTGTVGPDGQLEPEAD
jgi:hypothetical protein